MKTLELLARFAVCQLIWMLFLAPGIYLIVKTDHLYWGIGWVVFWELQLLMLMGEGGETSVYPRTDFDP